MTPAHLVEIVTPKKYLLNGLWLGSKRPKRAIVWVHGLGSSMFSKLKIANNLLDKDTAVLVFNNRGHDKVASVRTTKGVYIKAGAAHEIFTDCVDDIQGAINFARKQGAKEIFLAGHSTGSQKTAYWASKRGQSVRGIVLLGSISDFATNPKYYDKRKMRRAEKIARVYMRQGKKHELLPESAWSWPWIADAQRFLSLYSGDSSEEIFTYWDPIRNPRTLKSVRIPVLVLPAAKEEFADRPAKEIAAWFSKHLRKGKVVIVPRVKHSFRGGEKVVAREIRRFIKG